MGHRMLEPEFNFRSRIKLFVFGKDVTGLLEKTKQYHAPNAQNANLPRDQSCQVIIVAAGHWPFQQALSRIFMLFINVYQALRYCGMNDFKRLTGPQLNT